MEDGSGSAATIVALLLELAACCTLAVLPLLLLVGCAVLLQLVGSN